jgi:hypothetical protein
MNRGLVILGLAAPLIALVFFSECPVGTDHPARRN